MTHGKLEPAKAWHALEAADVLAALGSTADGLAAAEAARRLESVGPNRLPEERRDGPLRRFLPQFHNLLIYTLIAAGAVSAAIGHVTDALVIAAVVLVNAVLGFVQEGRAEKALDAIRELLSRKPRCSRDGRRIGPRRAARPGRPRA